MPNPKNLFVNAAQASVVLSLTPTLDTNIFASGDTIATAVLTFTDAVRGVGMTGTIKKLVLIDKDVQSIAGELWLFDTAVSPAAANAAHSVSDADAAHCIAVIPFGTYYASALNSVSVSAALSVPFKAAATDTNIYGILVTRGTPTYSASGLVVNLLVAQD